MKKICAGLLVAVLCALALLTGCEPDGGQTDPDAVTITVMGRKSDLAKSYMTSIFAQYEEATGNHIETIAFDDAEFESTAAQRFADGEVPDIFMHFHNADLARFDLEQNFLQMDDQAWVEELTDSTLAYCRDDQGHVLGLPYWENSVSGCYYNKTIFRELGLRPATTQSEFDTLCQVLADAGYTPICWPAGGSWMMQFALDPIFADDPDKLAQLNRNQLHYTDIPEITQMVEWIDRAAKRGWLGDQYLDWDINDVSPVMSSGEAVMTFMWDTWFYTDLEQGNRYTVDDFGLMPVFLNTAENGTYEGGNLNMLMVNKNGDHVDTCLEFLDFCADPAHYNVAFDGISTLDCFREQTTNIQSPMVTDVADSIEANLRPSTAVSKIKGYSADDDVIAALDRLFRGQTDVDGCVALLDQYRVERAHKEGIDGF